MMTNQSQKTTNATRLIEARMLLQSAYSKTAHDYHDIDKMILEVIVAVDREITITLRPTKERLQ